MSDNAPLSPAALPPEGERLCSAIHDDTGAVCELPLGHEQNHRGPFTHGIAQWPHAEVLYQRLRDALLTTTGGGSTQYIHVECPDCKRLTAERDVLSAEVQRLREQNHALAGDRDRWKSQVENAQAGERSADTARELDIEAYEVERQGLTAALTRLEEGVRTYGRHELMCDLGYCKECGALRHPKTSHEFVDRGCTYGFTALLGVLRPLQEREK